MQHHLKRERQFASQSAPELRRAEITRIVLTDGAVRVEELAERLNVSQVTVYRDIQYLEDAGLVERSKGELRPCATSTIELPPQIRATRAPAEKRALCLAATKYLTQPDTVMIDDSSTVLPLVPMLDQYGPMTLITNSLPVAESMSELKTNELVMTGGRYLNWSRAFFGNITRDALSRMRADACILSDAAVWRGATYNPNDYVIAVKRVMMQHPDTRIMLLDSSKFSRRAWQKTAEIEDYDVVIVTDRTPEEHLDALSEMKIELVIAPVERA